jgi:hypothetical protein
MRGHLTGTNKNRSRHWLFLVVHQHVDFFAVNPADAPNCNRFFGHQQIARPRSHTFEEKVMA